ncbi:hypothetical protein EX30DRAFT_358463 [Ascodesmis nigricans]|uniref:Uncharacterized protein n=1 Tax=Ascodesmis nigricans TaxID=341454 RepID=A0A4S2MZC0_9PEZI|nr:hypothetical protein EX30DRAFT_358463 [Ascodesmis nigricans]
MSVINTHVTLFPPFSPLLLPLPSSTPLSSLHDTIQSRLPPILTRLHLTTTSGRTVPSSSSATLSTLTSCDLLTLRLSAPLCGGKGGFGSQLRAAGGRMSSRKKSQENNDSCRNLSGRRLRTVKEAKALAAYLEIKPEMEKKEKEEKMKRWREIVEAAEKREEKGNAGARIDDVRWVEEKEEGKERVGEAVREALKAGLGGILEMDEGEAMDDEEAGSSGESSEEGERREEKVKQKEMRFAGWDEDDEFMSSDDEGMEDEVVGKGKGKAIAAAA